MSNSKSQPPVTDMDAARSFKDIEDAIQKAIDNETLRSSSPFEKEQEQFKQAN
ncbi:MAG: hypothetical protein AAGB35_09385 [Pseudomonadota bacterium]